MVGFPFNHKLAIITQFSEVAYPPAGRVRDVAPHLLNIFPISPRDPHRWHVWVVARLDRNFTKAKVGLMRLGIQTPCTDLERRRVETFTVKWHKRFAIKDYIDTLSYNSG